MVDINQSIKKFFLDYALTQSDVSIDFKKGDTQYFNNKTENWKVTIVDTGLNTMTGKAWQNKEYLDNQTFMMTYGDGLSNIDLAKLVKFQENKAIATLTRVKPPGRFGELIVDGDKIKSFEEKPESSNSINGVFLFLSRFFFNKR